MYSVIERQIFLDLKDKLINFPNTVKIKQSEGDSFAQSLRVQRWCNTEEGLFISNTVQMFNANTYIESGTANGYSTLWAALGLLNKSGDAYTWDAVKRPKIWDQGDMFKTLATLIQSNVDNFHEGLPKLSPKCFMHPIVFFVDGNHRRNWPTRDWNVCKALAQPGDVVILHDIFDYDAVSGLVADIKKEHRNLSIVSTRNGMGVVKF